MPALKGRLLSVGEWWMHSGVLSIRGSLVVIDVESGFGREDLDSGVWT